MTYFRPLRNPQGWTVVPAPSPSTIVVYVSNTGRDSDPGTEQQPLATLAKAWQVALTAAKPTNGRGDVRIRLKRGSVFHTRLAPVAPVDDGWLTCAAGLGPDRPFVLEAYGPLTQPRPKIILPAPAGNVVQSPTTDWTWTNFEGFGSRPPHRIEDLWLIGLEVTVDAAFAPVPTFSPPTLLGVSENSNPRRILIEDCYFHGLSGLAAFSGPITSNIENRTSQITVRRCVLQNMYCARPPNDIASQASGIFSNSAAWLLIEECWFDTIGFNHAPDPLIHYPRPVAARGGRSQAMYFGQGAEHLLIQNCVITRPALAGLQMRGNKQRAFNNYLAEVPIGIICGHEFNGIPTPPFTADELFWRGDCTYNVVEGGANLDRFLANGQFAELNGDGRGHGIEVQRCREVFYEEDGQTVGGAVVSHNLIFNNTKGTWGDGGGLVSTIPGFVLGDPLEQPTPGNIVLRQQLILTFAANVTKNMVFNWQPPQAGGGAQPCASISSLVTDPPMPYPYGPDFKISNNKFIQPGAFIVARVFHNPPGGTWDSNEYFSGNTPDLQFRLDLTPANLPRNFETFVNVTTESGAMLESIDLPDSSRNLAQYLEEAGVGSGLSSAAIDDLAVLAKLQRRGNWNVDLLASSINAWIRQGFGMGSP